MTLLLSNEEVESALPMPDCIAAMEDAYRELGESRGGNGVRSEILSPTQRPDALYSLLAMTGVIPKFGIGAVRINSDILTWPRSDANLRRVKVPAAPNGRYVGLVLLVSTTTGEPLAIYPDGIVQRMRVGATCGIAAKYLARRDASQVALLGSGWQAGGQLLAICAVRAVKRIRCFSPDPVRRKTFCAEMEARLRVPVVAMESAREAVQGADVVMCATNSMEPVLKSDWLEPGMHVSTLKRLEIGADVAAAADVVVTHLRTAPSFVLRTAGADLARDTEQQKSALVDSLKLSQRPELCELLIGRTPGRRNDTDVTLFLNYTGIGYQFAATGYVIYKNAMLQGIGKKLDTDLFTSAFPS